jgi:hypothetical protein
VYRISLELREICRHTYIFLVTKSTAPLLVAQHIQCVGLTRELDKEGAGSSGVVYTPAYTMNVVHILVTPLFEGKVVHQQLHHDRP